MRNPRGALRRFHAAVLLAGLCATGAGFAAGMTSTVTLPAPVVNDALWKPGPHLRWQLQYATAPADLSIDADVYKIDLFDNDAADVERLKARGKHVVCYLNAGAWEAWRPDAKQFPAAAVGRHYTGWPAERWLDIRRIDLLAPIMLARLDLCRLKGFDGVMFDNVDGYMQKTGFRIRGDDQLRFNAWIANEARRRGLSAGMNNNSEQTSRLLPYFDWAQAESCFSEGWCASLRPFVESGKAVVVIEYTDDQSRLNAMCEMALALRFSLLRKKRELDAYRQDCANVGPASARANKEIRLPPLRRS